MLRLLSPTQNGTVLAAVEIGALAGVVLVVVAAIALGWLAAGRAGAGALDHRGCPQRLRTATGQRLALSGPEDELKALGDTFDLMLERMVANLIENAVRHNHPGGSIWIRTRRQAGTSVLEVENTGPPVTAAQIPALFEPFARAQQRVSFDRGVGLGLSIADAIARAHDAEIAAHERDGGGLALTVTVPAD